ncbi:MAG: DUF6745 domain-containing protein [bacterium]
MFEQTGRKGAERIASDSTGTLWRMMRPGQEAVLMVEVVDATPTLTGARNHYLLRVPPTMRRAREAVAWTAGMTEESYSPAIEK